METGLDLQTDRAGFSFSEHRFNSRQRFSRDKRRGNNKGASAGAKMEDGGWSAVEIPLHRAQWQCRIWKRMRGARSRSGRGGTPTLALCRNVEGNQAGLHGGLQK